MKHHDFLVSRHDQLHVAQVQLDSDLGVEEIRPAITRALTKWVKTTDEGKNEWEESSHDFNIGDLSNVDKTQDPLRRYLEEQGIRNLFIEIFFAEDAPGNWMYDSVLVNESELEE
jgi:hypothetical protein